MLFCGSLAVGDLVDVNIGPRALEMQSLLWQHKTEALAETITCLQCRLKIEVEDLVTVTVDVPDGAKERSPALATRSWNSPDVGRGVKGPDYVDLGHTMLAMSTVGRGGSGDGSDAGSNNTQTSMCGGSSRDA